MGGVTILLENFPSMAVSNIMDFLKYGVADYRISSIFGLPLRSQSGAVAVIVVPVGILVPLLSLKVRLEVSIIPLILVPLLSQESGVGYFLI